MLDMTQHFIKVERTTPRTIAELGAVPGNESPELAEKVDRLTNRKSSIPLNTLHRSTIPNSGPTRREFSGSVISDRQKSNGVTPETLKPGYGSLQGNGSMTLYARLSLHRQTSGSSRYNSRLKMPTVFERTTRMIRMLGRKVDPLYGYLEVNVVRTLLRGSPYWAG